MMSMKGWCRTCSRTAIDRGDGKGFVPQGLKAPMVIGQTVIQCRPCWIRMEQSKLRNSCQCSHPFLINGRCKHCGKERYRVTR